MAVKIRLMRIGAKARPFYRIVAVDERAKRTGGYLELLGTYNPLTEPKEIRIDQEKVDAWVKKGAQMSVGYLRIIGKAPQRPARKPKKDRGESAPAAAPAAEGDSEAAVENTEAPVEETNDAPAEEVAPAEAAAPEANESSTEAAEEAPAEASEAEESSAATEEEAK